jgi:hypothetical protein
MNKRLAAFIGTLVLAAAPAAAFAPPAAVDPAVNKAVRELLDNMRYREQTAATFKQGATALPQMLLRAYAQRIDADPKLTLDQKKAELTKVSKDIPKQVEAAEKALANPKLVDDAVDALVPIYAAKFTLAELNELNELNAFNRRPVAVKLRSVMPDVSKEANGVVQGLLRERVLSLMPKLPPVQQPAQAPKAK